LSGVNRAFALAEELGLSAHSDARDGDWFETGAELVRLIGPPIALIKSEEALIGALSKSCGIATAARRALQAARPTLRLVSGGSKKMPREIKEIVRQAVQDGGLEVRMLPHEFVYLDKNYVRILGGVGAAMKAAAGLHRPAVIQVRGELASLEEEAVEAAREGAAVVMVDTGNREDIGKVNRALQQNNLRAQVELAFSGRIQLDELEELNGENVDVLDIGYAILDAPCVPVRFDVLV